MLFEIPDENILYVALEVKQKVARTLSKSQRERDRNKNKTRLLLDGPLLLTESELVEFGCEPLSERVRERERERSFVII